MPQSHAPYDAIFFDMDGTLLPMQVREFLDCYYVVLGAKLERAGKDPELFIHALNSGLRATGDHPSTETNGEAFWVRFARAYEEAENPLNNSELAAAEAFLLDFYANDFAQCRGDMVPNPAADRVIRLLAEKGYPLYLTTMPLFPREGVVERLRWAGVDPTFFARITTLDNSTAIKPQLAYYRENLVIAGALDTPARILMVGNDTGDDLSCLQLDMDAYLVTDGLINRNGFDITSVKHGSLEDFCAWAATLPPCTSTRALEGHPNRCIIDGGVDMERLDALRAADSPQVRMKGER